MHRFDDTREKTIRAVQSLHFLSSDSSVDNELPVDKNRSRNWLYKTLRGATRDSGDTEYDTAESFEVNVGATAQTPIANKYSTQRKMSASASVAIDSAPSSNVYPISSLAGTPIAMSSAVSGTSLPQLVQLTQIEGIDQTSSQSEGELPETDEEVNLTGQMPETGSAMLRVRSPASSAHLLQWGSNLEPSTVKSPENDISPRRSVTFEKSSWVPSPSPISDSSIVPSAQDKDNDKAGKNSPTEIVVPDNHSETITDDRTMHSARSSTGSIELAKKQKETPLQDNDSSVDDNSGTEGGSKSGKAIGMDTEAKDKRKPFSIAFTNWKVCVIYIITGLLLASLTINVLQLV
uniref:ARAD1C38478p n=1 Tax=Blastobotrys adeninivorans TaxID=409370 RepID=A0A060T8P6_BLAAD